jgi:hypothetical protein
MSSPAHLHEASVVLDGLDAGEWPDKSFAPERGRVAAAELSAGIPAFARLARLEERLGRGEVRALWARAKSEVVEIWATLTGQFRTAHSLGIRYRGATFRD